MAVYRTHEKQTSYALRVACLLIILSIFFPQKYAQANSLQISVVNSLVTIDAVDVPLAKFARQLSEATGIPVNYDQTTDQKITLSIREQPLHIAVTSLVMSNVFITEKVNGVQQITEIYIPSYSRTTEIYEANLPTGEPVESIIAGQANTGPIPTKRTSTELDCESVVHLLSIRQKSETRLSTGEFVDSSDEVFDTDDPIVDFAEQAQNEIQQDSSVEEAALPATE